MPASTPTTEELVGALTDLVESAEPGMLSTLQQLVDLDPAAQRRALRWLQIGVRREQDRVFATCRNCGTTIARVRGAGVIEDWDHMPDGDPLCPNAEDHPVASKRLDEISGVPLEDPPYPRRPQAPSESSEAVS